MKCFQRPSFLFAATVASVLAASPAAAVLSATDLFSSGDGLLTLDSDTHLEWLDLHGTQLSDVSPLTGLTSLKKLYLNGTQVSDVSPLAGLTNLEQLHLGKTPVTEGAVEQLQKALPKCRIIK